MKKGIIFDGFGKVEHPAAVIHDFSELTSVAKTFFKEI